MDRQTIVPSREKERKQKVLRFIRGIPNRYHCIVAVPVLQ